MKKRKTYVQEAEKLAKAIDIAIDSYKQCPPNCFTEEELDYFITGLNGWKESCLDPDSSSKTLGALKIYKNMVFEFFQKNKGKTVEYFWNNLEKNGIDYNRSKKPLIKQILENKSIKDNIEYEFLVDTISTAEEEYELTYEEISELEHILDIYGTN